MVFRKPNHNNVEIQLTEFIKVVNNYETALNIYEKDSTPENEILLQRAYVHAVDSRESIGATPVSILEEMSKKDQGTFGQYYKKVDQLTDHWFANEVKNGRANFPVNQLEGE